MSWMPSADPILGDKRSCDALELVVVPRVRDLGDGFAVRRAMPNEKRQMVGPFIFFDQMGPVQFLQCRCRAEGAANRASQDHWQAG
jgi:redox-sensitive bicupin YhaK (pirin superfamily)